MAGPATSGRGNTLCITLMCVVILLQLYAVSTWTGRGDLPHSITACPTTAAAGSASSALVVTSTSPLTSRVAAEGTELDDGAQALAALKLIQRYMRRNQARLDGLASASAGANGELADSEEDDDPSSPAHAHEHVGRSRLGGLGTAHGAGKDGVVHDHHAGDDHEQDFLKSNPGLYHSIWLGISKAWADDLLEPNRLDSLPPAEKERFARCEAWAAEPNPVRPDETWGKLDGKPDEQRLFDQSDCGNTISSLAVAQFVREHEDLYDRVWAVGPAERVVPRAEPGMEKKTIAIIVAMTTRSLSVQSMHDLALFKHLFPSLAQTAEEGFEYWFYLGYDKDDPWLDNAANLATIRAWFDSEIAAPLRAKRIVIKLIFSTWTNSFHLPGPAFNHVTGVAYADGAEFIYRINDDVLFMTPWAKDMTAAIMDMGYPYGVVGPACGQGATHILVVDMVHRTHHEIFPTHYPPSLQSWWMDNWVSQVYGRKRTQRINSARIRHLTESHGTRYVTWGHAKYHRGEIQRGRAVFEEFLSHTPDMEQQLAEYRSDSFSYHTR